MLRRSPFDRDHKQRESRARRKVYRLPRVNSPTQTTRKVVCDLEMDIGVVRTQVSRIAQPFHNRRDDGQGKNEPIDSRLCVGLSGLHGDAKVDGCLPQNELLTKSIYHP